MTSDELERRLAELRARVRPVAEPEAACAPVGDAIAPDPHPTPSPPSADARRGCGEPPLRHWQEEAEERALEARQASGPTRLQLEMGEVVARETACARLRQLLGDGAWHSALELVEAGGLRYGGRLHELRRGLDGGPPLDVVGEPRQHGGRQVWFYRAASPREA